MQNLLFHSGFFTAPVSLTFALIAILSIAAIYDVRTFTIPHVFPYAVVALFLINLSIGSIYFSSLPWHLLSVAAALVIGFGMFSVRVMGGGDVKLFAALAVWFFPLGLIGLILCITTTGIVISLAIAGFKMIRAENISEQSISIADRFKTVRKTRIPYGPAIAMGSIIYFFLSGNL